MSIIHYNNNPNQRPSNGKLNYDSFMSCALAVCVGILPPLFMVIFTYNRQMLSMLPGIMAFSGSLSLLLVIPFLFHRGYKKKKDFIAAGGDPTGINLWMFGSMGGKLLENGTWQWQKMAPVREDYYTTQTTSAKEIRNSK
jgi:hypothetical protein